MLALSIYHAVAQTGTVSHWDNSLLSGCIVTLDERGTRDTTVNGIFDLGGGTPVAEINPDVSLNSRVDGESFRFYLEQRQNATVTLFDLTGALVFKREWNDLARGFWSLNFSEHQGLQNRQGIFVLHLRRELHSEIHRLFLGRPGTKLIRSKSLASKKGELQKKLILPADSLLIECQGLPVLKIEVPEGSTQLGNITMPKPPNVVIMMVDDLGWMDVGYKHQNYHTPNIDQLKNEGTFFARAYIATPTCSPSRATLVTGKHPARLKMPRHIPNNVGDDEWNILGSDPARMPSRNWLPLEEVTYAEALKTMGYYNSFIGKWHLGKEPYYPVKQGFDEEPGTSWHGHPENYYPPYYENVESDKSGRYLTDYLTDQAVDFLDNYDRPNPFTLTLLYHAVHTPVEGRTDLIAFHEDRGLGGWRIEYAAMVSAIDESLGRVRAALAANNMEDSTIIIWYSDQGGDKPNTPLRGGKKGGTAFYEGGTRVPFIVHWPGTTSPGDSTVEHISSTDIFPTLVDIAGGNVDDFADLDGISIVPLLKNQGGLDRNELYFHRSYEDQYASVLQGDIKLIAYRSGGYELYNIEEDVSETNDLAPSQPQVVQQLAEILDAWEVKMDVKID